MDKNRKEFLKQVFYNFDVDFNDELRKVSFSKTNSFTWETKVDFYSYDFFEDFSFNQYTEMVNNHN